MISPVGHSPWVPRNFAPNSCQNHGVEGLAILTQAKKAELEELQKLCSSLIEALGKKILNARPEDLKALQVDIKAFDNIKRVIECSERIESNYFGSISSTQKLRKDFDQQKQALEERIIKPLREAMPRKIEAWFKEVSRRRFSDEENLKYFMDNSQSLDLLRKEISKLSEYEKLFIDENQELCEALILSKYLDSKIEQLSKVNTKISQADASDDSDQSGSETVRNEAIHESEKFEQSHLPLMPLVYLNGKEVTDRGQIKQLKDMAANVSNLWEKLDGGYICSIALEPDSRIHDLVKIDESYQLLERGERIGKGSFKVVRDRGHYVAIFPNRGDFLAEEWKRELRAIRLINSLKCDRLAKFEIVSEMGNPSPRTWLIQEKAESDLALMMKEASFTAQKRFLAAKDIATALSVLHNGQIVHRDIKPDNILWFRDRAVLTDFGFSAPLSTCEKKIVGTPNYMSLELLQGKFAHKPIDVFACALVINELIGTGKNICPIFYFNQIDIPEAQYTSQLKLAIREAKNSLPSKIFAVVEAGLRGNYLERDSIDDILRKLGHI